MKLFHKKELTEEQKAKRKKRRKRLLIFLIILALLCGLVAVAWHYLKQKTQVRMLLGTMHFANETLEDESYLAYGVDIMELIHDYVNADVQITGRAGIPSTEKLKASTLMDVTMTRSFSQKRMAATMNLNMLWIESGTIETYGEDETVYLYAPMISDDFGYAFPTGIDLFMRMPDLTHDINQQWFSSNWANIVELLSQIEVVEQDTDYTDENGNPCDCYEVTIPQGCGDFIWDLLGMDYPDYDVVSTIWINDRDEFAKVYMNLSDVLPGAEMEIDGTNFGKVVFTYQLPQNEWVECIMTRNVDRYEWIDTVANYYANNGDTYHVTCGLHWEDAEEGFAIQVKEAQMSVGEDVIATGYFKGTVVSLEETPDVFGDREQMLYGFEELDWRAVRDDVDGFTQQIIDKLMGKADEEDTSEFDVDTTSSESDTQATEETEEK